ncbi:uncharacterized protein si:dkey-200l5.4 isoform X3 [Pimephales promelas]|uniref:uncharacterized protein si:dkey-200l5.4 isoform X3 n=1 Tax=Pimephales promelas TaxID=90988 RepID=UPI001955854F|nr:uncharacterized protein si:dkey-200l5.4 isoform X3 [Pimephales promelas]KAG1970732.1 hypothetical protein F2P79_002161 [Pimephales promelas]
MRTGIAIMLFVAVAGFHNAISASLEFDESNKSPEERMYEENVTTTQPDDSEYAAAHVNVTEDLLKTTHMDGETEALTFDTDGETEALTVDTGENTGSDESVDFSEEDKHIEQAEETVKITGVFFDDAYEEQSVFE